MTSTASSPCAAAAFRHIGFAIDGMPARYLMHTVQGDDRQWIDR